jgi:predicted Zn-dependent peptidase
MDEIKRNIEGVTAQDVQNVANEIFAQEKLSKLMYL